MLHLLTHTCPACNGPHQELPTAQKLRPYYATYTPSKFPAPLTQSIVGGGWPGSGTGLVVNTSVSKKGIWHFSFFAHINGDVSDVDKHAEVWLLIGGSEVARRHTHGKNGNVAVSFPPYTSGVIESGTSVQVYVNVNANYGMDYGPTLWMTFIPTPAYPQ